MPTRRQLAPIRRCSVVKPVLVGDHYRDGYHGSRLFTRWTVHIASVNTAVESLASSARRTVNSWISVRASARVLRYVRKTYRCDHCDGTIQTAPAPIAPIPGSIAVNADAMDAKGRPVDPAACESSDGMPVKPGRHWHGRDAGSGTE